MVFNPLRSIQHGFVVHKQRIVFRGIAVSLSKLNFLFITPFLFISPILPSLPPSLLIRTGHVPVGRGRRRCPSAAACQRRRSAVLQTAFTPWWAGYTVTLYIKYVMCNACMKGF